MAEKFLSDLEVESIRANARADSRRMFTVLITVLALGAASYTFTTWRVSQDFRDAKDQLEVTCQLRNDNVTYMKQVIGVIAADSADPETRRVLLNTATELQYVDCGQT
jgi:hypothetical protein